MTNLIVTSRNFVNVPNKEKVIYINIITPIGRCVKSNKLLILFLLL
jgi:hypothetical protein